MADNYTTSPQNWSIIQDNRGLIYIANTTILFEFDGSDWNPVNGTENLQIISIARDKSGRIYGGGIGDLGYIFKDSLGKAIFKSLLPLLHDVDKNSLIINHTVSADSGIYFTTDNYILRWNGKKFKIWKAKNEIGKAFSVNNQMLAQLKGVGLISLAGDSLKLINNGGQFKDYVISDVLSLDGPAINKLLIVTRENGIYNEKGELLKNFKTLIYDAVHLSNGNIALATHDKGVIIINKEAGIERIFDIKSGLLTNECKGIYEDNDNLIWVGLNKGISSIGYNSPVTLYDISHGLPGIINCLTKYQDGVIAGTSIGLFKLNNKHDGEKASFTKVPNINFPVWDTHKFKDHLLIATTSGVFDYINGNLRRITPASLSIPYKIYQSLNMENIFFIGLSEGLTAIKYEDGDWKWIGNVEDIDHEVRTIAELDDGTLWASYMNTSRIFLGDSLTLTPHVEHFDSTNGFTRDRDVFDLFTLNNQVYCGTYAGIYKFNEEQKILIDDTVFSSFLKDNTLDALSLKVDSLNNVWLTSDNKVVKFEKKADGTYQKIWKPFTTIPKTDVWGIYPENDGTAWFCTSDGLYGYNSNTEINYNKPFNTLVRQVSIKGDSTVFYGAFTDSLGYLNLNQPENTIFSFPYKHSDISFRYAATDYKNPEKLLYSFKLEGYDKDWSPWSAENKKEYTGLWEGKYIFKVRAKNAYDIIGNEAAYQFSVLPPLHRTWWAYTIYALLLAGMVTGFIHYRTRMHRHALRKKQLELEKEKLLTEKLKRADRLKDEFLANTSHELRTPLTGIIGLAESLHDGVAGEPSDKMRSNLSMIVSSGKRLSSLVNSILDFSKLKTHELNLNIKTVDIKPLVDVVLNISAPMVAGKDVKLNNQIPSDIHPIAGDEDRLQQILHNLVGNAIKFTERGEVVVDASEQDGFVEIAVKDTGIGIPEDKRNVIFESFEQLDSSAERKYVGTGLGLSITRKLVELHGGTIKVESAEGSGSTFLFTIPVAAEKDLTKEKIAVENITSSAGEMQPSDWYMEKVEEVVNKEGAFKILVVDDEPVNQQVVANHLSFDNYEVYSAMNGEEALNLIEEGVKFDLILLDIMMPKISGYEVCKKIRKKYLPNELPIVMLTAKNQVSDLVEGFSYGANDYLTKPFSKDEFLARIKTHLNLFKINSCYGKFVPHEFLRKLGHESIIDVKLGDQVEGDVTILFSDIRSYTTLSEGMTPKENFDFLNAYLSKVGPVIKEFNGFVNQYYGDGIMALFLDKPEDAISASINMLKRVAEYNEIRTKKNRVPIKIGIGLHSGPLMLGIIGDEHRMDASVVSDSVNMASRMEGLTKYYGASIIISENTFKKLANPENFNSRLLGKVQVKGKNVSAIIYEIFDGDNQQMIDLKVKTKADFEEGLRNYFQKKFSMSAICFEKVLDVNPEDKTAKLYFEHAAQFMVEGVPEEWTGIETIESK